MPCCCCYVVSESNVGVVETCGKFSRVIPPGCQCILPWSSVVNVLSTRVEEDNFSVESKTKDNVFVDVKGTIQYQILPLYAEKVHYCVAFPVPMLKQHVLNSIRAKIPLYLLEALYVERSNISQQLKQEVDHVMEGYGIDIISALVTDIRPSYGVSEAMNQIQKVQRLRVAAEDAAETKKLTRVRAAEGVCAARRLAGEGLAEQRKAIVAGLVQSMKDVRTDVPSLTAEDAAAMLLMNQYYDTLRAVASKSKKKVLVWETTGGLERVSKQLTSGLRNII